MESQAFGINELGQAVGSAQRADGASHAFLFNGSTMKDLGTVGGVSSFARDVNRYGQVVGESLSSLSNKKAFLYSSGQMRGLGTLGGSHSSLTPSTMPATSLAVRRPQATLRHGHFSIEMAR